MENTGGQRQTEDIHQVRDASDARLAINASEC